MRWPAKRVEGVYASIVRSEAVQSIEGQRRDMIAACYTNPNWDGKDNAEKRKEYIRDINKHFNSAITRIYYPKGTPEETQEIDWDNPFFAAHKREIARTNELFRNMQGERPIGEILAERSNGHREIDQLEA